MARCTSGAMQAVLCCSVLRSCHLCARVEFFTAPRSASIFPGDVSILDLDRIMLCTCRIRRGGGNPKLSPSGQRACFCTLSQLPACRNHRAHPGVRDCSMQGAFALTRLLSLCKAFFKKRKEGVEKWYPSPETDTSPTEQQPHLVRRDGGRLANLGEPVKS